ncbi:branched-chain amino acid aminotransferase [Helicocarpus griseus UAMH5409]|uniref:Branched-chain amino acid aminotransferase n=1 Tax=Helicocarpus griseus UAMH5409 TaxID=1447875 RepID=A0A2B7WKE5_9EURO|nr:branched-chain amino acid aminotransferase [Helicocarpus griseus UAMH5409]
MTSSSLKFPPPPVDSIDWSNVGFKVREVNGHVESHFSHSSNPQWSAPRFVASPFLPIHGLAPGLNYGQQAYEGMKAFRHAPSASSPSAHGRITIFRPQKNAVRMQHSAEFISIPPVPQSLFLDCVRLAVAANAEYVPPHSTGAAMYIRPLIFGSSAQLGLSPPDEYTFAVFVMPTGVYHGVHAVDALILEDFDRSAPDGTGSAKVGGNYAPVLRHSERARAEGYGITLHLDSKTRSEIDEFSTSAFIGVRKDSGGGSGGGGITLVVPDSKNVIDSVTSSSICEIGAKMFGYKVERRRVTYDELAEFSEVMAAGTAAALVPIKSITMKSKSDRIYFDAGESGEGGDVCRKLLKTLKGIQTGEVLDEFGWLVDVEPAPEGWVEGAGGKDVPPNEANLP